jgi:hypothetical protein
MRLTIMWVIILCLILRMYQPDISIPKFDYKFAATPPVIWRVKLIQAHNLDLKNIREFSFSKIGITKKVIVYALKYELRILW